MRKRIYVAGPITRGDLAANVNQGVAALVALCKAGFSPFCPMLSVYAKPCESGRRFDGKTYVVCEATVAGNDQMTHADWMGVDLPWVAVSDAVLRLPGESTGADLEVACAKHHGIPVFESVEALVEWRAATWDGAYPPPWVPKKVAGRCEQPPPGGQSA